ncbi:MAG: hypothetical protein KDB40_05490 [Acidimicrobiales bacterium]|nr:hypothetical protein [Acidimicrobiales bacterium]MCB9392216.1 hypothetical protein [Acidimicrobiaceae bacterium]
MRSEVAGAFPVHESALRRLVLRFDVPLIQNDLRSAYVEEQVGVLLGAAWRFTGGDWGPYDFESGGVRLEVKQSAALQSWPGPPGRGAFNIAPRTGYYVGAQWVPKQGRHSDIHVFAWHGEAGPTADHRDVNQWIYFVCPTVRLPEAQRSLSRPALERLAGVEAARPAVLCETVATMADSIRRDRATRTATTS